MCDGDVHRKLSEGQDVMRKRHYVIAKSRFGESGVEGDGKGIERLDIRLEDPFTADIGQDPPDPQAEPAMPTKAARSRRGRRSTFSMLEDTSMAGDELAEADAAGARAPAVQLTFHGAHVFAGIRKLVESGAVDGRRMPGWMSGENGVSTGAVRHGRIRGNQGSGLWHGGRVVGIGGLAAAGV
jgi:central kinetochore subunit Mis15/CHL4